MILQQFNKITDKTLYILLSVFLFILFGVGFFLGRYSKNCPKVKHIFTSDTTYNYTPITGGVGSPLTINTKPQNVKILKEVEYKPVNRIIYKIDTFIAKGEDLPVLGFESTDTLRFDSLFIAIKDKGDCNGILERKSSIFGKVKERIITNNNTEIIELKPPLFQLNAGVQAQFNKEFLIKDIAPSLQVEFKQKYSITYGYLLSSKNHNFTLLTKIK